MKVIKIEANPSGSRPGLMEWNKPTPPEGWASISEELAAVFYPQDKQCAGFVRCEFQGNVCTVCEWDDESYQAYIDGLPAVEEVEEIPTAQDDTDAMLVDLEYRLTMLELNAEKEA